uniref:Uncharacterized protein n=1 Tax=Neobodo designis TaxID=312471 RepID=A0A7S1MJM9_NEODS|mmetsp:Transcript_41796/g.129122  ORF Transcript_41796/g.129122 Transcript_41796/m.129122 type:complete len:217 (+) Transcript_41796:86-736(+)
MSDPYVLCDELSDIASTCTTARGPAQPTTAMPLGGFGLSVRAIQSSPSRFRPGPVPTSSEDAAVEAEIAKLRDSDDDGTATGTFADPSMQRINVLESALGEANRELRARAQAEEQLASRVDELVRVVEEQRAIIAAKDAEIVRLTTQATLVAEVPKARTRLRRGNIGATSQTPGPSYGTGAGGTSPDQAGTGASSVPTLPPIGGGAAQLRSQSSLL